jgi:DNA repair protein RecN (Recombination protein N)
MLLSLHIENVAVIKQVSFEFTDGFTVMTGETGAGKSVVIDCINLLLGAKAERELIRKGAKQAMVSGLFSNFSDGTLKALADAGVFPDDEGNILVERLITADGKSKIFINARPVTLAMLKSVTPSLVTIHAQSTTAALMDSKSHIELVDVFSGIGERLKEYRDIFSEYERCRKEILSIKSRAQEAERYKEILRYQISDIDSLGLHDGEEEELVDKKVKIKNSEKISKNTDFVFRALKGSEKGSAIHLLDRSSSALSQIADVVPAFSDYSERLRDIMYQLDDIAESVYEVLAEIDENPTDTLNAIEARLDKISRLKRKYGLTVKDCLDFRDNAKAELEKMENSDGILKELCDRERTLYKSALRIAEDIHGVREASAKVLEEKIKSTLEFLDMPKVVFFVQLKKTYKDGELLLTRDGIDEAEFYISANRGADAQPLSKVASGGELSRIMLSLKSVIADKDGVPTIIYDEIDAGVSGKTARKIGIKMQELSRSSQLFCVTHSAQIASLSDKHYLISKSDVDGATETAVTALDYEGRVAELSRILGGINITESQREAARDMLSENCNFNQ